MDKESKPERKSIVGYCEICGVLPCGMPGGMGKEGRPGRSCIHGVYGAPGYPGYPRLYSDVLSDEYTNDEQIEIFGSSFMRESNKLKNIYNIQSTFNKSQCSQIMDIFDLYELCKIVKNSKGHKIVVHKGVCKYFIDLSEMNKEKKLILTKLWSSMLFAHFIAHCGSTSTTFGIIEAGTPLKYSITQTNGVYIYNKLLIKEYKKCSVKIDLKLIEINNKFITIDINFLSPKMMKVKTKLGTLEEIVAKYDSHELLKKFMDKKIKGWSTQPYTATVFYEQNSESESESDSEEDEN